MKKQYLCVILLLSLCLMLCACDTLNEMSCVSNFDEPATTHTHVTKETIESGTDGFVDGNLQETDPTSVYMPQLTIESYDEYLAFVNKSNLPTNFVQYEAIAQLGSFKSFVCLTDARFGDYTSCMYNLFDSSGTEFFIYVDLESSASDILSTSKVSSVNGTDMRTLNDSSENGIYLVSDLEYRYVAGTLLSISWTRNNVTFTLTGNAMLGDYPENVTTTVVGKMLNIQSAKATVDSIEIEDATS